MNVFYSSLAFTIVLPALLCSIRLSRRGKIALWTTWSFFVGVTCIYVSVFTIIIIIEAVD